MISIDDFKKIEIKAGKIIEVEPIEGSEKLLKLMVDFDEGSPRQIISGIKKYFKDPKELINVTCAFVTNLEPREIFGLQSNGMIMAASKESTSTETSFSLLKIDAPAGSKIN